MLGFDPHPYGCPIGARVAPKEMHDLVRGIWAKLRDVVHVGVFVVNPSKGDPYPLLFLSGNVDGAQRVVLFPGWEDDRRRRRVDYARQVALLQRISDAGIAPEPLESTHGTPSERLGAGALYLPVDVQPTGMSQVLHDLWERLGAYLRLTVTTLDGPDGPLQLVRAYVLDDEVEARLVLYPGWKSDGSELRPDELAALEREARVVRGVELPIEVLFGT
jgi:hypothetical protein